ncbi:hypothetical protein DXG01_010013, partial [Tephrocybe rancida]
RQARESRVKRALRHLPPGKKGAQVFIWTKVKGYRGFRVRDFAGRQRVDWVWKSYGNDQRHYDAFRDEWDLCSEFGEDDVQSDSSDDEYTYGDYTQQEGAGVGMSDGGTDVGIDIGGISALILPDEQLTLPIALERSTADLQRMHGKFDAQQEIADPFVFLDTLDERAYYWYGFISPASVVASPSMSRLTTWNSCREYLGNGRWLDAFTVTGPTNTISVETQESMRTFFDYLLGSKTLDDIPSPIYDARTETLDLESVVRIRAEIIYETKYYFVQSCNLDTPVSWEVVLTNPAAVVGLLRGQWGQDFLGLLRELLNRGIPFKTCIHGPLRPPPPPTQLRFKGLGYRPPNHRPDAMEYAAYESLRDDFLRSPRGRAALLQGGIVSRLAREVVQYQHVFDGPTPEVFDTGTMLPGQNHGHWDDALTDHEINIICGVYQIDTGGDI